MNKTLPRLQVSTTMKIIPRQIFSFPVFVFLICTSLTVQSATIKCWTNKEGVRECGTTIPPEYAQQGHEELNDQGRVIGEQERAKTKEEVEEANRLAAIELEKQKAEEEKIRRDKILLDTYTKVEDIEKVRDDNVRVIQSRITLTRSRIDKTQADLDKRIQAAAEAERDGKQPNDALLKDIETLRKRIKNNQEFIAEREKEIESVKANYDSDIDRFKELKNE